MNAEVPDLRIYIPHKDTPFCTRIALSVPLLYVLTYAFFVLVGHFSSIYSYLPFVCVPVGYGMFLMIWMALAYRSSPTRMSFFKRGMVTALTPIILTTILALPTLSMRSPADLITQDLAERIQPALNAHLATYNTPPSSVSMLLPSELSWHLKYAKRLHFYYDYLAYNPYTYDPKLIRYYKPKIGEWRIGREY